MSIKLRLMNRRIESGLDRNAVWVMIFGNKFYTLIE